MCTCRLIDVEVISVVSKEAKALDITAWTA